MTQIFFFRRRNRTSVLSNTVVMVLQHVMSCNIFVMFVPLFFFRQPPPPFVRETEPEPEPAPTPTPSPRAATEEPEDTADLRNKVQKLDEEVQQVRCHWEMSWDIRLSPVTLMLA